MSERERIMIQGLLDDTHDQFIGDVALARSMSRDSIVPIADGRIFTGRQALKAKLIDTLGGYEAAMGYLRSITGVGSAARVITKKEPASRMRDWFTSEIVRLFPQCYRLIAPAGTQCLTVFE
jgi:protease-4